MKATTLQAPMTWEFEDGFLFIERETKGIYTVFYQFYTDAAVGIDQVFRKKHKTFTSHAEATNYCNELAAYINGPEITLENDVRDSWE